MRSLLLVMLAACTDHGQSPGMADASFRDGTSFDILDPCPGGMHLTGELIDWDSPIGGFTGVFEAKIFEPGNPTPILSTPPNGRMDTCVATADPLRFDVDAPTDYLDGSMVIQREALTVGRPISFRSIKMARATSFFAERGLTFNPNRAQVVVFLAGDRSQIGLDRPHDTAQAGNDDGSPGNFVWTVGDTGRYVLFPNVDTAQATGMITGPLPAMAVPLAPGKLTLVAVSFVFI